MNAIILICGFGLVGLWLEGINGRHGVVDDLLRPHPLILLGCAISLVERLAA